jgi:peptidoglycan-associated lipoprotein
MRSRFASTLSVVALAVVLAACGSSIKLDEPAVAPTAAAANGAGAGAAGAGGAGAAAGATPQSQVESVNLQPGAAAGAALMTAPTQRIVYFDFDSFAIRGEFNAMLEGHARALAANPDARILVEGHTDERGGREYNLALGQKRAEAVLRSLTLLGANERQLEAVSFGKERPVAEGSNEEAWALNRRAELKDR